MIQATQELLNALKNPVRNVGAVANINGIDYPHTGNLVSFTIDRIGEDSKFFGFGICQKTNVKIRDVDRLVNPGTKEPVILGFGVNGVNTYPYPNFYITEVHRDENTNQLSITAYDVLYNAPAHTITELDLPTSYSIADVAIRCGSLLTGGGANFTGEAFNINFPAGANLDGSETIKDALDAIAQATQTIYYIDNTNTLTFKMLDKSHPIALQIDKSSYYKLDSSANRRLATIISATELGDNYNATTGATGSTQFVRNNPFWELREDLPTLLGDAITRVGDLTINQFDCSWRGNYLLEPGDCIALTTKDNDVVYSFVLNDSVSYNGTLSEQTQWSYTDNEAETFSNPITLGEALKQTYAKVDKINREITLVASEITDAREQIGAIQINTDSISQSVTDVERRVSEGLEDINEDIEELTKRVEQTITADDLQIKIEQSLENGITSITTTTGFTFNEEGLTVSKTGSEMTTQITEDGMTVYKNNQEMLVADNHGVIARNLTAETYLIIGLNSRFEDYDNDTRTGCFWIGN